MLDVILVALREAWPSRGRAARPTRSSQSRLQLVPVIVLQEVVALDAGVLGQAQQPALLGHEAAVEVVELLDELLDPGVVEAHLLHQLDDLVLHFS